MDNLRQIVQAYHGMANPGERAEENEYFKKLPKNSNGEIRFMEYNSVSSWLSNKSFFDLLDSNKDGVLSRSDARTLYYIEKKLTLPVCKGCRSTMLYTCFTCNTCLNKQAPGPIRFDLCNDCFANRTIRHEHPWEAFSDQFSLLENWKKMEMEKVREIAKAHYEVGPREVRELSDKFSNSMGLDNEHEFVDLVKFQEFMRREGYQHLNNPSFFKKYLDKNGEGKLDSDDVRTLFYILRSGRPPCNSCGEFVPGQFFTCTKCLDKPRKPYNLCLACYELQLFRHTHDDHVGQVLFLDSYTLFEIVRDPAWAQPAAGVTQVNPSASSSSQTRTRTNKLVTNPSTTETRVDPANNANANANSELVEYLFKAFQVITGVAGVVASASGCSIL